MSETRPSGGRGWPPNRKRALFGSLLVLDAVVTLFPPLYWAVGSGPGDWAVLLYFLGGSAVVLASILVMYAVDRTQAGREEVQS